MLVRLVSGIALAVLLSGCDPAAQPVNAPAAANAAAPLAEPAPEAPALPAADASLRDWLVGSWSFGDSCASDFYVRFQADGTVDNTGDQGSWSVEGDTVTERITTRFQLGEEAETRVDPPEVRSYSVERIDATRGRIRIEDRNVPILRC